MRTLFAAVLAATFSTTAARADNPVGVPGSSVTYPPWVTQDIGGGKSATMRLTGTGLRKRAVFSVYAIGSYVDDQAKVESAEALASADVAKELFLVLERDVDGKDFASAFTDAIRKNHGDSFAAEVAQLVGMLQGNTAKKGDQVVLINVPGVGLYAAHLGKKDVFVASPAFSKAVWEMFLGRNPVSEDLKRGLVSLLNRGS
jgi:hypothetical protein